MIIEEELDKPVTCPSSHPVGRQVPLYEEGATTGWFLCEVCRLQYRKLADNAPDTCDMDGCTEDTYGGEHYWHCEHLAVYEVDVPKPSLLGDWQFHSVRSKRTRMKLCWEHLEEVTYE